MRKMPSLYIIKKSFTPRSESSGQNKEIRASCKMNDEFMTINELIGSKSSKRLR
jgi:hypothetical protein